MPKPNYISLLTYIEMCILNPFLEFEKFLCNLVTNGKWHNVPLPAIKGASLIHIPYRHARLAEVCQRNTNKMYMLIASPQNNST